MKKIITLLAGIACLSLFTAVTVNGQPWTPFAGHCLNPNNPGFVGIGTNAVAPVKLLDVYRNMTEPTIRVYNMGGIGGATFEMTDLMSGANWKFKATVTGGFKIRDNTFGLDVINVAPNSAANSICIAGGTGNVGLGTNLPLEKLHVTGAIHMGNTPNNNPGTIRWDGTNFQGHNGVGWVNLDFQWNDPWILAPNIPFANSEFSSGPQPMSLSFAFPGVPNPMARLYVTDMSALGLFPHQVEIESISLGGSAVFNASQLFRMSAGMNPPFIDYSVGIFGLDGTFKVCLGAALTATAQSDNTTMIRTTQSGIVDLPNQSRIRAYQLDPAGFMQTVPPGIWVPVNFTNDSPLPAGYDEQNEFTVAATASAGVPPELAYFTAAFSGYYQVNARCEFNVDYYVGGPVMLGPNSYVSIAIYSGAGPGATSSYAIGNNLQIGYANGPNTGIMYHNNAPNVSDVVYLQAGQIISIWVYHSAITPMDLVQGSNKVYVSIHKVS